MKKVISVPGKVVNFRSARRLFSVILTLLLLLMASMSMAEAGIFYVDSGADGANNGASWDDAFTDLQDALAAATSGDEIWVAAGEYKPTTGDDRTISFVLKDGVAIYGGFAGGETARDQRDWELNATTLRGFNSVINSYHVVTCGVVGGDTVLDGVTIYDAKANGSFPYDCGAGLYNDGGSPTVENCTFYGNKSYGDGGGMYNSSGSPTVENCTFYGNKSYGDGGGMYNSSGNPTVINCTFWNNNATYYGGGIYNSSGDPVVTNCTFNENNVTLRQGGGMYNNDGSPIVTNCTFSENSAYYMQGGGMYNSGGSPIVTNCTFSGNEGGDGGGIYNADGSSLTLTNTILADNSDQDLYNTGTITSLNNIVETYSGYTPDSTDITGDQPELNLESLADNGGPTLTQALLAGSIAIDAGTDSGAPGSDQRGVSRDASPDIGAYEDEHHDPVIIYVDSGATTGNNDGSSWTDAFTDLQDALAASLRGDQIWVKAGEYKPHAGSDRSISFELKNGVEIYGGFAGGEEDEDDRDQRDWQTNTTTLSGNIGDVGNDSDNSLHVVKCGNLTDSVVMDGFTITKGNGDGLNINHGNPNINNCTFSDNLDGIYNYYGSPTVTNCTFSGSSIYHGRGMYNYYGSPTVTNCTFSGISTNDSGAGMCNNGGSPTVTNCTFSGNSTNNDGGGMYNYSSSPVVTNCTFSENSARYKGDGIYNDGLANLTIKNTILADNGDQDLYNEGGITSSNNIVETYSGFTPDPTDITGDQPELNLGPLADNGGPTLTHALLICSVAIDAGTSTGAPTADQRGVARDGNIDIGAYEHDVAGSIPTVSTTALSDITSNSASSGGYDIDGRGGSIVNRGVCWGASANPTTGDSCTSDSVGAEDFTSGITGLNSNTTYHVRAYVRNCMGTGYGTDLDFTTSPPTVTFTSASQSDAESSGTLTVTAELSVISGLEVEVPFTLSGTATDGGTDYSITASPITIPAGSTTQNITITINDDTLDELDETVIVTMGTPTNADQGATTVHTATITDNDDTLVSFTSASQTGSEGSGTLTVTAELSAISGLDVEVPFTLSGTATDGGTDYSITGSPITIPAGSASQNITITINDDALDELDETVIVTMGTPINADQGATTVHTATITDNDDSLVSFTSASQTGSEGSGTLTVTAELSVASIFNVDVPFTVSGTATGGGTDYSITGSPITIPAGSTSQNITITINDDVLEEYDETVIVTMGTPTNAAQGATTVHTVTITDNDDPLVSFTSAGQTGSEGSGTLTVTAELSVASIFDVDVPFTVGGTATGGGTDYSITGSPITIPAGSASQNITITINDDALDELDETVIVTMGTPINADQGATTVHTATITDNDDSLVSFTSASQTGSEGSGTLTVTAELSVASIFNVDVPFTVSGTATGGGTDYSITGSPITIPAGSTSQNITITINDDVLEEYDETVIVTMGTPTNAAQGATTVHTVTITDNDDPLVSFTSAGQTGSEGSGTLTVTAELSVASIFDVDVPFTVGGTATGGGTDYSITGSPITIPAGSASQNITITINDDALDENDETVIVTMGTPINAAQGATTIHTATIMDNENPLVSFTSAGQTGSEGSVTLTVTAELSVVSVFNVDVPFNVSGTATGGGTDYSITASPITIPAGSTSQNITITINDDALDELYETVIVTMGTPTNADQGATTVHTATITDNDDSLVSFTSASQTGSESSVTLTVTAELSVASIFNVDVPFTVSGTATGGGTDYTITGSPITIPAGSTSQNITITVNDDPLDEPDETIILTMGSPTNAAQGTTTVHTATILDNDVPPSVRNVSASNADGYYKQGDTIGITVEFDKLVNVTGTPQLTLETGTSDAVVNFSGGSGSDTLTFQYTVADGHAANDLDYVDAASLVLNGGAISDAAGNEAVLTLPAPGTAGSLGFNKSLVVDTAPPTVDAGPDSTEDGVFNLDGSADDTGGSGLDTTFWSKESGPGNVFFDDDASPDSSCYMDVNGDYELRLTATDKAGNTATDEVTVTWNGTQTHRVDTLADETDGSCDDGDCSLRDAIALALPKDRIEFDVSGTITLGGTELSIDSDLTINGPANNGVTIDGDAGSRVFNITGETVAISNLTISGGSAIGSGGGILNAGDLILENTTISGNTSEGNGGGIGNTGILTIRNSTISGNASEGNGGGIDTNANLTLNNVTIYDNKAGGADNAINASGSGYIGNSIVAGGCTGNTHNSMWYNIETDTTCGLNSIVNGDLQNTDPLLNALADNGGPTFTHALQSTSPAIDAGDNDLAEAADQRGINRPVDGDFDTTATADIGAFEYNPGQAGFSSAAYKVNEGDGRAVITVTRTGGSDGAASVTWTASDGTALDPDDYTATDGVLNWTHGDETDRTFEVVVIDDDVYDPSETINLDLNAFEAIGQGDGNAAVLTIEDNDNPSTSTKYSISGQVTDKDTNDPIAKADISFSHNGDTTPTDNNGNFYYEVDKGTSTTITPDKTGYISWEPSEKTFDDINENKTQNFQGVLETFTISGRVTDGTAPIEGVTITFSHNGDTRTTDAGGYYSFTIAYGSTTTVTPSKTGWGNWQPASKTFENITENQTGSFTGELNTYEISGRVVANGNALEGATITFSRGITTTDADGRYSFFVDHGTSTVVTPSHPEVNEWSPSSRELNEVSSDQPEQDFAGTLKEYNLTVAKDGDGTGLVTSDPSGIDCGSDCTEPYPSGTQVTLTASADADSIFTGWSDSGCGSQDSCTFTMDESRTITAVFQKPRLYVYMAGTGQGTVTSSPSGIDCGSTCSSTFDLGSTVLLTAVPDSGSIFTGWSGGGCEGGGVCSIKIDGDISVSAVFNFEGQSADLAVTKYADTFQPNRNESVTFTIRITNNGPDEAGDVEVTDQLPPELSYIGDTSPNTYDPETGVWTVGKLERCQTAQLQIFALVDSDGVVTNTAQITSSSLPDLNEGNDTAGVTLDPLSQAADIYVRKTGDEKTVTIGDDLNYTITAGNNGPAAAEGVILTDVIPAELTDVEYMIKGLGESYAPWPASNKLSLGTMEAGAARSVWINSRVALMPENGVLSNRAKITSDAPDTNTGDNASLFEIIVNEEESSSDLSMVKEADNMTPFMGENTTFDLTVTNLGPDRAEGIRARDRLSTGLDYSSDDSGGSYNSGTGIWKVGDLEAGSSKNLKVTAKVTRTGKLCNMACVLNSRTKDHNKANNSSTLILGRTDCIDPSLSTSIKPLDNDDGYLESPVNGDRFEFTVTLENNGAKCATCAQVKVTMPDGLVVIDADPSLGCFDVNTNIWHVDDPEACTSTTDSYPDRQGETGAPSLVLLLEVTDAGLLTQEGLTAALAATLEKFSDMTNNSSSQTVSQVDPFVADLAVQVLADRTEINANEEEGVLFTTLVRNTGPDTASSVQVQILLPAELNYVSNKPSLGTFNRDTGLWSVGNLAYFEQAVLELLAMPVQTTDKATFTGVLSGAAEGELNSGNNSDSVSVKIISSTTQKPGGGSSGSCFIGTVFDQW